MNTVRHRSFEGPPISLRHALRGTTAVAFAVAAVATVPAPALARIYELPTVAITSGPAEGSRTSVNRDLELAFETTADNSSIASYDCTLDGQALDCWKSAWLEDLADGEHVLSVTVTDERYQTSEPAVRTFTVDATGPAPTLAPVAETLPTGPVALSGTAGTAAFDDDHVDVVVVPYVEGMQHSLEPVAVLEVPVVDGAWAVTTPDLAAGTYIIGVDQFDDLFNYGHAGQQITVVAPAVMQTPTPAPAPAAPAAPAKPAAAPAKPADPKGALAQTARGLTQTLSQGGIDGLLSKPSTVASFQAPGAGTVTVQYLAPRAKGASAKRAKRTPVVVATGTKTVGAAGKADVKVTLTKAGRATLKAGKRVSLIVRTSFTAKGAKSAQTSSSTVMLKKKKGGK